MTQTATRYFSQLGLDQKHKVTYLITVFAHTSYGHWLFLTQGKEDNSLSISQFPNFIYLILKNQILIKDYSLFVPDTPPGLSDHMMQDRLTVLSLCGLSRYKS